MFFYWNIIIRHDIEVNNFETITSYFLMTLLKERYPYNFSLIIGADLLPGLNKWEFADKLKEDINFIIFERPNY